MQNKITGECFCGKIGYEIKGKLRDARSCHCSRCRKAYGAQASAYALVDPEQFSWTRGETNLTSYVGSHGYGLQFCQTCGSTLCGIHEGTIHGVTLGCINGDPQIEIGFHIYVGSKAAWEILPEGATMYEEGPPDGMGVPL